MNWKLIKIPEDKIQFFIDKLDIDIKNGNPQIDNLRCIYTVDESNITYLLTPFDFVDLNPRPKIKSLTIGQVLEK